MGYFLFFLMLVVELLSLAGSFVFGTFVIGPRDGGGGTFHWLAHHFVHLAPWWRQLLLHTDGRGWGVVWVAFNLLLQLPAILVSLRQLHKARLGLGKPQPGDVEWAQVERCYQQFEAASIKTSPQVRYRTPGRFCYKPGPEGQDVEFVGRRLVIGEHLLTPNNRHLAPLLAHELAHYNSGDLWFKVLLDFCPEIWFIRLTIIGLPVSAVTIIRDYVWPVLYWKKREFLADEFACKLGQCNALIRTLEARRARQRRRGPFRAEPYIQERINRLRRWRANQLQPQVNARP